MILLLLAVLLVGVAVQQALAAVSVRRRDVDRSIGRVLRYGGYSAGGSAAGGEDVGERLLAPLVAHLAAFARRFSRAASTEEVTNRLRAAGLGQVTPTSFLAVKGGLAGATALLGVLLLVSGVAPLLSVLVGAGGAYVMLIVPESYLSRRTASRKDALVRQMPDVLDLLTVSIEAGLGFDQALGRVGERLRGPLIEELEVVTHEMRIGESRQKALRSFAERLDLAETTAFARAITQADQLGLGLGRILRVQSQELRHRRQMLAEERAMKAPVKMLIPTALFVFPAMFVVILGPAALELVKSFAGAH